jgi:cell division protease FtsH
MGMPFNFSVGKLKKASDPKTSFSDVAGMEECKAELQEIVDYLKNPEKYIKV